MLLLQSTLAQLAALKARLSTTEEGQGLVEYALILVLVAIVVVVAVGILGQTVAGALYGNGVCIIANTLANSMNACGG